MNTVISMNNLVVKILNNIYTKIIIIGFLMHMYSLKQLMTKITVKN